MSPRVKVVLELEEEDRQLVLLALATLACFSPGFDDALNRIACRIDTTSDGGRAALFEAFRAIEGHAGMAVKISGIAVLPGAAAGLERASASFVGNSGAPPAPLTPAPLDALFARNVLAALAAAVRYSRARASLTAFYEREGDPPGRSGTSYSEAEDGFSEELERASDQLVAAVAAVEQLDAIKVKH